MAYSALDQVAKSDLSPAAKRALIAALQSIIAALLAVTTKLDSDAGVTDTDYGSAAKAKLN